MSNSGLVAYGVDSDEETDKNSGAVSGNEPTESSSQEKLPSREGASVTESEKETEKKRSSGHSDREKDRRHDHDRSRDREDRYHRDRNKRSDRHDDRRDRDRRRDDRPSGRDRRDDRRRRSRDRDHRRARDRSRSPKRSSPSPVRSQDSNTRKDVHAMAASALPTQLTGPGNQPRPPVNATFTAIATKAQRAQEEIQKRKALWNKDKPTTSTGLWSATAFTEDQDGKVSAKFKRLMGIKNAEEASGSQEKPAEDLIKKQQELFANLDAQYAVARATTHTQRGLGLGFGSQNFHH